MIFIVKHPVFYHQLSLYCGQCDIIEWINKIVISTQSTITSQLYSHPIYQSNRSFSINRGSIDPQQKIGLKMQVNIQYNKMFGSTKRSLFEARKKLRWKIILAQQKLGVIQFLSNRYFHGVSSVSKESCAVKIRKIDGAVVACKLYKYWEITDTNMMYICLHYNSVPYVPFTLHKHYQHKEYMQTNIYIKLVQINWFHKYFEWSNFSAILHKVQT